MPPANPLSSPLVPDDKPAVPSNEPIQADLTSPAASTLSVDEAPQPNYVINGQSLAPQGETTGKLKGRKRLLILAAVGVALVLGGSASAYYLGVVAPNNPDNLWQTALERTSKGYDGLVAYTDQSKDLKGVQLKGDYKLEGSFATDGTFEAQSYDNTATFKADMGIVGSRVTVEGQSIPASNSKNPDLYIKASGLKGLAALQKELAPITEKYENQWLVVDHTLFDNLEAMAFKDQGSSSSQSGAAFLTTEDFTQIAKTIGDVNKEYLFTTDSSKAVMTVAKQVGKEQKDGRTVYHYEVGMHKQHAKDYLNAMVDSLQNTPATKLTNGKKLRDAVDMNNLLESVDDLKDSDTAHVYVDMDTRLIRTVRIEGRTNKQSFVELTQNYTGGDVMPFAIKWHDNTDKQVSDLNATFNVNKKTNITDGNLMFDAPVDDSDAQRTKLSVKYTINRNNNKVEIQKPEGAKSLYELLGPLITQYLTVPANSSSISGQLEI